MCNTVHKNSGAASARDLTPASKKKVEGVKRGFNLPRNQAALTLDASYIEATSNGPAKEPSKSASRQKPILKQSGRAVHSTKSVSINPEVQVRTMATQHDGHHISRLVHATLTTLNHAKLADDADMKSRCRDLRKELKGAALRFEHARPALAEQLGRAAGRHGLADLAATQTRDAYVQELVALMDAIQDLWHDSRGTLT
jgi:hypothetical protein